jgi:hypothetical protein
LSSLLSNSVLLDTGAGGTPAVDDVPDKDRLEPRGPRSGLSVTVLGDAAPPHGSSRSADLLFLCNDPLASVDELVVDGAAIL